MTKTHLGDEGGAALAEALRTNTGTGLASLALDNNALTDALAAVLADALAATRRFSCCDWLRTR